MHAALSSAIHRDDIAGKTLDSCLSCKVDHEDLHYTSMQFVVLGMYAMSTSEASFHLIAGDKESAALGALSLIGARVVRHHHSRTAPRQSLLTTRISPASLPYLHQHSYQSEKHAARFICIAMSCLCSKLKAESFDQIISDEVVIPPLAIDVYLLSKRPSFSSRPLQKYLSCSRLQQA